MQGPSAHGGKMTFKLIWPEIPDMLWLQCLEDLEELDASPELLAIQLKCRPNLDMEKRALHIEHLKFIN